MKTSQSGEIADRLVADAERAGLRLARGQCTPNIVIVFVDDGTKEVEKIWKRRPQIFGSREIHEVKSIINEPGPAHSILSIAVRSADGRPLSGKWLKIEGASQISLPIRYDILSSVLIIDRKATIGLTLTQLADYAAMRTLTNSRAGGRDNDGTILGLFNSAADRRAAEMTMFDREYLHSVYIGNGNVRSLLKVDQIARNVLSNANAK